LSQKTLTRALVSLVAAVGLSMVLTGMSFAWEGRLYGQPSSYQPGQIFGIFAWAGDDGLHIRTSAIRDYDHNFQIQVSTDGQIVGAHLVLAENDDSLSVAWNNKSMTANFHTFDGTDGVDYAIEGGNYQSVTAWYQGSKMQTSNIYLGSNGAHPEYNPFTDNR
jgi:hypothetical protein